MASDQEHQQYMHVVRVLLDAEPQSSIDIVLRNVIDPTLARLKHLINVPGLNTITQPWRHPYHDMTLQLNTSEVHDIISAHAFVTWFHDTYGRDQDIRIITHELFRQFTDNLYNVYPPSDWHLHDTLSTEQPSGDIVTTSHNGTQPLVWRTPSSVDQRKNLCGTTHNDITREVHYEGSKAVHANVAITTPYEGTVYRVSRALSVNIHNSLVDRGANGGIMGEDMRLIEYDYPYRYLDVQGIDNHEIPKLKIGTAGAVARTNMGYVILIFHQYACYGRGKSIHSSLQLADNKAIVDDKSYKQGGTQSITTLEGHRIPLDFHSGLPYMALRRFTDEEYATLPHVFMTRDTPWDPGKYDSSPSKDAKWYETKEEEAYTHPGFDVNGDYIEAHLSEATSVRSISCNLRELKRRPVDSEGSRRFFLNQPVNVVEKTFENTTQYYKNVASPSRILHTYKTPYPAANVPRRPEPVATDTVFSNVTAFGGSTCAQIFVGRWTRFMSVYGCTTDGQFAGTLADEIRKRGAMTTLISDRARAEISKKVVDILRSFMIDDWQSEPHHQEQNYCERMYQELKKFTNWVLNRSGAPSAAWLLVFQYVVFIMNRTARETLNWRPPYEALYGNTPDISVILQFVFWEKCYIRSYEQGTSQSFPAESDERLVRFAGFGDGVGTNLTFKVWDEATQQLLYRSEVRQIEGDGDINVRCDPDHDHPDDPSIPQVVQTQPGRTDSDPHYVFDPADIIGRSFLLEPKEDGTRSRGEVTGYLEEYEGQIEREPERVKFKVQVGEEKFEEMVLYNEMCDLVEQSQNEDGTWNYKNILGHREHQPGRGRKSHQVLIEWESGERSWEPITEIYRMDKYFLAEYARDNGLLDTWDGPRIRIKNAAKNAKKLIRFANQAKLKSFRTAPVYMYGHEVPRNHDQAVALDLKNGNTKWQDSEKLETSQLMQYEVFDDRGHKSNPNSTPSREYKKITLHFVYAVKHDGRYKSRAVAGGHLTDTPTESVYSGVVSLRGIRIVIFLAELNDLDIWQTDVGNAYTRKFMSLPDRNSETNVGTCLSLLRHSTDSRRQDYGGMNDSLMYYEAWNSSLALLNPIFG